MDVVNDSLLRLPKSAVSEKLHMLKETYNIYS